MFKRQWLNYPVDQHSIRTIVWRFLLLSIPLTLFTLAAYTLANVLLHNLDQVEKETKVESAIDIGVTLAQHDLETVTGHLDFLVESQPIKRFISQDSELNRLSIQHQFVNLSNTSHLYDQVRLLGPNGKELVRVDYRNKQPLVIPQSELQNKSSRYYFQEAAAITTKKMYVSPLDLNIENGKIEQPLKPMIRFARPLRNEQGELKGVIVLNYLGALFLDKLRQEMRSIPGEGALVNKDGYWLASEDTSKEWGFMLDHHRSFKSSFPEAWNKINQLKQGEFISNGGKFSFATVHPIGDIESKVANLDHFLDDWKIVVVSIMWNYNREFFLAKIGYLYPVLAIYPIGLILIFIWARASVGKQNAERELKDLNHSLEKKVKDRTKELEVTKNVTILSMATLAETRDDETGQHIRRTQRYVRLLATELQSHPHYSDYLSDDMVKLMYKSAPLHDIGKVGIPDEILLKPGKLTFSEFEIMKTHTLLGAKAIESSIEMLKEELSQAEGATFLQFAQDIAHYHHEKWDGSGYPEGLSGYDIPLAARIMAVADVFDALSCRRVYKAAFDREMTEKILFEGSGKHFEPAVIEVFRHIKDEFWAIRAELSDDKHIKDPEPLTQIRTEVPRVQNVTH